MNFKKPYVKCDNCGAKLVSEKEYDDSHEWWQWFQSEASQKMWKAIPNVNDRQISLFPLKNKKYINLCPYCFYRVLKLGNYHEYTDSIYFLELKKQVHERDGYRCVRCKSGLDLRAHHTDYEHMGRPELEIYDLLTVCETCHQRYYHANDLISNS